MALQMADVVIIMIHPILGTIAGQPLYREATVPGPVVQGAIPCSGGGLGHAEALSSEV